YYALYDLIHHRLYFYTGAELAHLAQDLGPWEDRVYLVREVENPSLEFEALFDPSWPAPAILVTDTTQTRPPANVGVVSPPWLLEKDPPPSQKTALTPDITLPGMGAAERQSREPEEVIRLHLEEWMQDGDGKALNEYFYQIVEDEPALFATLSWLRVHLPDAFAEFQRWLEKACPEDLKNRLLPIEKRVLETRRYAVYLLLSGIFTLGHALAGLLHAFYPAALVHRQAVAAGLLAAA